MKLIIAVCTLFVLSFINSSEAECSDKSWVPVKDIQVLKLLGRWYSVLRFTNGKEDNSDCLWHDLTIHPTLPNSMHVATRRSFKYGKGHTKKAVQGALTLADPSKGEGKLHIEYQKGSIADKYIVAVDYDDYALLRACYGDEEHFWVYSRNQQPTEDSWTNINKTIADQGIDTTKLIKSCTAVRASEIV